MGVFTVIDSGRTSIGSIATNTGPDGKIRLQYQAPQFGGRINVVAQTVLAEDTLVNANQLVVEVPGLVLFPFDTTDAIYEKIGGTTNHPGPDDMAPFGFDFRPDTNHWGRTDFIDSLLALSKAWNEKVGTKLFFNDLSLPNGGMFDVGGLWTPYPEDPSVDKGHNHHRVGRDVDIRTPGGSKNRVLRELIRIFGGCPEPLFEGNHYHMYFYPEAKQGECKDVQ